MRAETSTPIAVRARRSCAVQLRDWSAGSKDRRHGGSCEKKLSIFAKFAEPERFEDTRVHVKPAWVKPKCGLARL